MAKAKAKSKKVSAPVGRPSLYKEEYAEQARKLCLLGATDKDMADFFEVEESTINNWKNAHPEFLESIRVGKKKADMEIAASLFDGAMDRRVIEQVPIKVRKSTGKGQYEETVEVVDVEKFVPGDFRNQRFWLINRQPDQWRDKQEIDHTTKGDKIMIGYGKDE